MSKDPIKKADNGTYYFRANLGFHPITKKQIQKYQSGFKSKREAREAYSKLMLTKPEEFAEQEQENEITFKEFIQDVFLPWYKSQVKERTYDNRLPTINKHLVYFYPLKLSNIEPLHVQKWQLKLTKSLAPSYVRAIQGLFSMAMDRAVVLGLAGSNPAKIIGNVKKQKTKIDFWTKEEFEKVLALIYKDDYYQHFIFISLMFLFMTGARIGEATAIQWNDIDFESGILKIEKNLYYKNLENYRFVETKTKASERHIVLDSDTLNLLREWKEVQQAVVKTGFVMSYNGHPTQKHTLAHAITRYAGLAGVHRIRIHALRHSHASLLISMGENPLIIKERLGHEEIETTLGTYGHLYPNSNFDVAYKLKGILQYQTAPENKADLPKNQFTASY
jgi:integrase